MLVAACQMFMDKGEHEVHRIATETLEGHQRAIMGNMTVEVHNGHVTHCCAGHMTGWLLWRLHTVWLL